MFAEPMGDGVKVTVLTNSLAANDEPLVHTGYARYREALLRVGVDLYELSPTRVRHNQRLHWPGTSLGRLHAKLAVVDRRLVFVGSMNLDPRSASKNTELGIVVEGDRKMFNPYGVILVNPAKHPHVKQAEGRAFIDWLVSTEGQAAIASYKIGGEQLFFPDARR